jgi:signal transduction histidine kinase/AmiR/NasT family two-component response regulator
LVFALSTLVRTVAPVSHLALGREAREKFIAEPMLRMIPVQDQDGTIVGVLDRFAVLGAMSVGFGREIYERRCVSLLMRTPVSFVQSSLSIEDAARVMAEQGKDVESTSAAVLMQGDIYLGILDSTEVFRALANLFEVRARELEVARCLAQTAVDTKSNFLSAMSHEIRTPLNGIMGMAQALASASLPPKQMQMAEVIVSSGEVLMRLLNDVLDMSRVEAGKLDLDVRPTNLHKLIETAALLFQERSEVKGVGFDVDLTALEPLCYECDSARVKQIIYNLISNAVKFTQNGAVSVRASTKHMANGRTMVSVSVSDTGMGMSPETLTKLFQPFSQADARITREYGGSGLGLSICSAFVELMGGKVEVQSVVGEGSCFTVHLPMVCVTSEQVQNGGEVDSQNDLPPCPSDAAMRILVAEDNPTNRLVLKTLLSEFEADITFAEDGLQAVEAFSTGQFDLVLMDLQMPNMDGFEATRTIRKVERIANRPRLPILALSANAMHHHVDEALAAGMDGHVSKPIMLPTLLAAIESVLEKAEAASHQAKQAA